MLYTVHSSEGTEDMAVQNLKAPRGYNSYTTIQIRWWPPPGQLLKEFQVGLFNKAGMFNSHWDGVDLDSRSQDTSSLCQYSTVLLLVT